MKFIVLICFLLLLSFQSNCQNIYTIFSKSSQILDSINCDFNYDGINDIICITEDSTDLSRTLFIFKGLDAKNFEVVERNDTLILKSYDGDIYGDPYSGMSYSKDGLIISFYGGSSWRWNDDYYYCYDLNAAEWFLFKEISDLIDLNNIEDINDTTSYSDTTYFKRK